MDADNDFALYDQKQKEILNHKGLKDWVKKQLSILSFEKGTGDLGAARDESEIIDSYHKEREWRLVPLDGNLASGSVVKDKDERGKDRYHYMFRRADVNVVVTPNNDVRTKVLRFLLAFENDNDERLREFAENPLPIITYDDLHKW